MMQQWYQCPTCGGQVAYGTRFCVNCGVQLNWPTQQQTQPPPSYQEKQQRGYEQGQAKAEQEKPKQSTNPVVEGFKWIGCLFFTLIFIGFLFMLMGTTGDIFFDIGRYGGIIVGLLLIGWFISWLTKKRKTKGDK